MEARGSRRQPQPSPPTSPSSKSAMDVEGNHSCSCIGDDGHTEAAPRLPSSPASSPGESGAFRTVWIVIACLSFPTLAFVSGAYRPPLAFFSGLGQQHQRQQAHGVEHGDSLPRYSDVADSLLGGLLAADFAGGGSCLSRHEATMYRRPSPHRPSPLLVAKLRRYEALHRRCNPRTKAYEETLRLMKNSGLLTVGGILPGTEDCRYLVWTPENGLGNRMIGLASAFLYALLVDRVLLIDRSMDMEALFCEPFPGSTWLLPLDFPVGVPFYTFNHGHAKSYGHMLKSGEIDPAGGGGGGERVPAFVYVHLSNDYDDHDKRFFCEPDQRLLHKVPWVVLRSDMYFAPALFTYSSSFGSGNEVAELFPEKETVFHLLSRYLFHPTDQVWGRVTRYFRAYLAPADERLGLQLRVFDFDKNTTPADVVLRQVLNCTFTEKLLPLVDLRRRAAPTSPSSSKAVLVTSLRGGYYESLRDLYWGHPAAGGAVVGVHQPSHDEVQQTEREDHDVKALADIYLLSLSDELVTSAWSTFGYAAQGVGGLRPWILLRPWKGRVPEPACVRAMSIEPCYDFPPNYDCEAANFTDMGKKFSFLRQCEDLPWGLKMVEPGEG